MTVSRSIDLRNIRDNISIVFIIPSGGDPVPVPHPSTTEFYLRERLPSNLAAYQNSADSNERAIFNLLAGVHLRVRLNTVIANPDVVTNYLNQLRDMGKKGVLAIATESAPNRSNNNTVGIFTSRSILLPGTNVSVPDYCHSAVQDEYVNAHQSFVGHPALAAVLTTWGTDDEWIVGRGYAPANIFPDGYGLPTTWIRYASQPADQQASDEISAYFNSRYAVTMRLCEMFQRTNTPVYSQSAISMWHPSDPTGNAWYYFMFREPNRYSNYGYKHNGIVDYLGAGTPNQCVGGYTQGRMGPMKTLKDLNAMGVLTATEAKGGTVSDGGRFIGLCKAYGASLCCIQEQYVEYLRQHADAEAVEICG